MPVCASIWGLTLKPEPLSIGAVVLERVHSGRQQTHYLNTVLEELGLGAAERA